MTYDRACKCTCIYNQHTALSTKEISLQLILRNQINTEAAYNEFGQRPFKKLVWMKPGSRQPTVRAGGPAL